MKRKTQLSRGAILSNDRPVKAINSLFESLEGRQLLSSISLSSGVLTLTGDSSSTRIAVDYTSGATNLTAKIGSTSKSYAKSSVTSIKINGGSLGEYISVASALWMKASIYGNGGNDTVWSGSGSDTIYGGDGNDLLGGRVGNDSIKGDAGNDTLDGGDGTDFGDGGTGTNTYTNIETKPSSTTTTPGNGLLAEYYNNSDFTGTKVTRNEQTINFNWGGGSPDPLITADTFSARFTGQIRADKTGTHTFSIYGDNGVRLWVNNTQIINKWSDTTGTYTGNISLTAGTKYSIKLEYFENTGGAYLNMSWTPPGGSKLIVPQANMYSTVVQPTPPPTEPPPTEPPPGNVTGSTGTGSMGTGVASGSSTGIVPDAIITAQQSSVSAGHAVHVHAVSSSLKAGTPLTARYEWDFGDTGSKYNRLVGFNASHIYDKPGTYTITLRELNETGGVDVTTKSVTITTPSRRNIYVSSAGSDSNSGSSTAPIKTFAKAVSMLGSGGNTGIYFRRGDTFSVPDTMEIGGTDVVVGAYGTGNLPILKYSGPKDYIPTIWTRGVSNAVTIENLTFDSIYGGTDNINMPDAINAGGTNTAIRGCQFLNVGYAVNANMGPRGVTILDSSAPSDVGLRAYFLWAAGSDFVVLGNKVANSTRQHVVRVASADRLLIGYNDFTNRSRVSAGDSLDVAKTTLAIHKGNYAYIIGNVLNNGPVDIGPLGQGDGLSDKAGRWNYAVAEGNRFNCIAHVLHGAQHTLFRNNVSTTNGYSSYLIDAYDSTYARGVVDVSFYNNTAINTATDGNMFRFGSRINGVNIANNLYSAPNLIPGINQAAPVTIAQNDLTGFTSITNNVWAVGHGTQYAQGGYNYLYSYWSNSAGYKDATEWNSLGQVGTDYFADLALTNYAPSSTSVAANGGTGGSRGIGYGGVFNDYRGNARPTSGSRSVGAIEV